MADKILCEQWETKSFEIRAKEYHLLVVASVGSLGARAAPHGKRTRPGGLGAARLARGGLAGRQTPVERAGGARGHFALVRLQH